MCARRGTEGVIFAVICTFASRRRFPCRISKSGKYNKHPGTELKYFPSRVRTIISYLTKRKIFPFALRANCAAAGNFTRPAQVDFYSDFYYLFFFIYSLFFTNFRIGRADPSPTNGFVHYAAVICGRADPSPTSGFVHCAVKIRGRADPSPTSGFVYCAAVTCGGLTPPLQTASFIMRR